MIYTGDLGLKQGEARQIQWALLNLVLHSRVHGRRTCESIGNGLLCTYKSVILHRATATATAAVAVDHDDSNIETSHTVNKETTRGGSLYRGEGGTNALRSAGKRVRGSIPAHEHVAAAFRGMGVKGGEMGGVIFYIGVAKY